MLPHLRESRPVKDPQPQSQQLPSLASGPNNSLAVPEVSNRSEMVFNGPFQPSAVHQSQERRQKQRQQRQRRLKQSIQSAKVLSRKTSVKDKSLSAPVSLRPNILSSPLRKREFKPHMESELPSPVLKKDSLRFIRDKPALPPIIKGDASNAQDNLQTAGKLVTFSSQTKLCDVIRPIKLCKGEDTKYRLFMRSHGNKLVVDGSLYSSYERKRQSP